MPQPLPLWTRCLAAARCCTAWEVQFRRKPCQFVLPEYYGSLCQLVLIVCLLLLSSGNMTCHWGSISNINEIYYTKEAFGRFSLFRVITSSRTGVQKAHS